ncbi:unnamed protein product, partial [marine sediment metagenome]
TCLKQGCYTVAVTLGKGMRLGLGSGVNYRTVTAACYVRDTEEEYAIEPISRNTAPQIDTTGAGDAFATGFLYGLLRGKKLEECGHLGDIVARFSISQIGARDGLPTLDELTKRYYERYNKQL